MIVNTSASILPKKKPHDECVAFVFRYFLFPFPAFFASISCLAAKRAGDLYGRVLVFFFGLNAIIRVIVVSIQQFIK
jgi:hypothetical protein